MFNAADEEGKGYLSRAQATGVVQNVAAELSFSEAQVQYIMTEADENHDGMIDFNEFQPLLLELVQLLIAKQDVEEKLLQNEAIVEDRLLHGMDRTTLNQLLLSIFQSADDDQSGFLNRVQFQNALKCNVWNYESAKFLDPNYIIEFSNSRSSKNHVLELFPGFLIFWK